MTMDEPSRRVVLVSNALPDKEDWISSAVATFIEVSKNRDAQRAL